VPDHSTFSKNRHGRFKESRIYQQVFDEIVQQCIDKGLVSGSHLTVDSTLVKANASFKNLEPIVVTLKPGEYLDKVENENPVVEQGSEDDEPWEPEGDYPQRGQKVSNQTHRSRVDPDSRIARKSNFSETHLSYGVSYVMDNKSRIIVGADQNPPIRKCRVKALELIRAAQVTLFPYPPKLKSNNILKRSVRRIAPATGG